MFSTKIIYNPLNPQIYNIVLDSKDVVEEYCANVKVLYKSIPHSGQE